MSRKVIQIAATAGGQETEFSPSTSDMLYALCDDGTLWELYVGGNKGLHWKEIPDVPQPEELIT